MSNVTIEGLDAIDLVNLITKKNRRFQAVGLQELEMILDQNSEEFKLARKLYLDMMSSYTRSIVRLLFGDIETEIYKE